MDYIKCVFTVKTEDNCNSAGLNKKNPLQGSSKSQSSTGHRYHLRKNCWDYYQQQSSGQQSCAILWTALKPKSWWVQSENVLEIGDGSILQNQILHIPSSEQRHFHQKHWRLSWGSEKVEKYDTWRISLIWEEKTWLQKYHELLQLKRREVDLTEPTFPLPANRKIKQDIKAVINKLFNYACQLTIC